MSKKVKLSKQEKIDRIKDRMNESGVTQSQLANAVGQNPNYICNMLAGRVNISGVMFLCMNHYFDKITPKQ